MKFTTIVFFPLSFSARMHDTAAQSNSTDEPIAYGPQPSTITPWSSNATSCSHPLYVTYR